ncbi:MAG TPA: hypothetical protein VGH73_06925 [Thermoanaerobaculia bacterium]
MVIAAVPFTSPQPQGGQYQILITNEMDPTDKMDKIIALAAAGPPGDNFQGTARRAAKLSISAAQVEHFDDLQGLIASLVADADMEALGIPTSADSGRVEQEDRNVEVRAFLYAASRESDNDFHLILGPDPSLGSSSFMTMEVSGLPPDGSGSLDTLSTVRDTFKGQFDGNLPGFGYNFFKPPIPVDIGGSLFFDATHASGGPTPGPRDAKPVTIWEVHPVTTLTFEPG